MILSAIGLPVPGASSTSFPPTIVERPETSVQAVAPTTASGGSVSAQGSDVGRNAAGKGESGSRRSVADSQPAVRRDRDRTGIADRPAGPQPAFEIAVLEKLREDVMRMPPEKSPVDADDPGLAMRGPGPVTDPTTDRAAVPVDDGAEARPAVTEDGGPARGDGAAARTDRSDVADEARANPARVERREAQDPAERRVREPADDGFDDARRISGAPSPRSLDVTS